MKSWTVLLSLLLVCGLAGGGFYLYNDHEFRKVHGRVTEVGLTNFEQEVKKAEDIPVLLYFYESGIDTAEQDKAVADFAWRHAGEVKVLKMNLNLDERPENLILAFALGVFRTPAFVIAHEDRVLKGTNGAFADRHELERLLERLSAQAPKPAPAQQPAGK